MIKRPRLVQGRRLHVVKICNEWFLNAALVSCTSKVSHALRMNYTLLIRKMHEVVGVVVVLKCIVVCR